MYVKFQALKVDFLVYFLFRTSVWRVSFRQKPCQACTLLLVRGLVKGICLDVFHFCCPLVAAYEVVIIKCSIARGTETDDV
jgi:hypothetical protein